MAGADVVARQFLFLPLRFQPIAQRQRRETIVGVVERDRFFHGIVYFRSKPKFQTMLHLAHRGTGTRLQQTKLSCESVKKVRNVLAAVPRTAVLYGWLL